MGVFHRYKSEIHGNYRRAYLRCGGIAALLLGAYILVRLLIGNPVPTPTSLPLDGILIVLVFLFMAYYRNSLPDKKITLKEALLFGIGTAAVAALLFALILWIVGLSSAEQTVLFTNNMTSQDITPQDPQLHYWAAWWAIVAGVELLLLGSFAAFIAAIFFRNEKSEIKQHKQ